VLSPWRKINCWKKQQDKIKAEEKEFFFSYVFALKSFPTDD
jgi:hypothetical protein